MSRMNDRHGQCSVPPTEVPMGTSTDGRFCRGYGDLCDEAMGCLGLEIAFWSIVEHWVPAERRGYRILETQRSTRTCPLQQTIKKDY